MKKSFQKQILDHNVKKFCLIVRANLDMLSSAKLLTETNPNAALQITLIRDAKKSIEDLKWDFRKNKCQNLQYSYLTTNYWYIAKIYQLIKPVF